MYSSFIVFFGIITPFTSSVFIELAIESLANLWPSVPTKVNILLSSSFLILKYRPLSKYLVSSFEIANLVLSIKLKIFSALVVTLLPSILDSINGKSSFGKHDKENLETPDLKVNILPSFEIISILLWSWSFLIISYINCALIVVAPSSITSQFIFSFIEISISVEDIVSSLFLASIRIFDSIGNTFLLSTILCRWVSDLKIVFFSIINFIKQI